MSLEPVKRQYKILKGDLLPKHLDEKDLRLWSGMFAHELYDARLRLQIVHELMSVGKILEAREKLEDLLNIPHQKDD